MNLMNLFKKIISLKLIFIFLLLFSIKIYASWDVFVGWSVRVLLEDPNLSYKEFRSVLEELKIETDLSDEVLEELKNTEGDAARLFRSKNFRKTKKNAYLSGPDNDVFSINNFRSAIDVLQSKVHRDFFFSLFDPSDMGQVDGLFLGLRVHRIPHREIGLDETMEIARQLRETSMLEEWVLFRDMAQQAVSEDRLRVSVTDIEASFFSAFGRENYLLSHRPPVRDSFRVFTDDLISSATDSERLVDLYKSPYCNLPEKSPYRENFLSAVRKSDLDFSDREFISKWWKDVSILARQTGKNRNEFLKPYLKIAFDRARGGNFFSYRIYSADPFVLKLTRAAREDRGLGEAMDEVLSWLKETRGSVLRDYDIDTVTR